MIVTKARGMASNSGRLSLSVIRTNKLQRNLDKSIYRWRNNTVSRRATGYNVQTVGI